MTERGVSEKDGSIFRAGEGQVQLSAEAIAARIAELGREIAGDYRGQPLHLICVLNGAFIFMADLVRAIPIPVTTDFIAVSSYGSRTESSGEVRLVKDLDQSLKNKHVLLVEDIVDTGLTMRYLLSYLQGRGPLSVKVVTLLSKPSRRQVEVPIDYQGFEIEDAYVYGYGLDRAHFDRNIPFITSRKSG
ncbi:hypoxanthine phosphoribosyltransferase [soil metagenome]|jgi:hypoxanthine phosphoribosyltransferase|nr:hypoxanthine phosphoribosyltransferase [Deinococcota bacterium]